VKIPKHLLKEFFMRYFSPCINLGNKAILDDEFLAIKMILDKIHFCDVKLISIKT
jgi:hypothetical protein